MKRHPSDVVRRTLVFALVAAFGAIPLLVGSCSGSPGTPDGGDRVYVGDVAPAIESAALPEAIIGRPYQHQLHAAGTAKPFHWSIAVQPASATWLTIDPANGALAGLAAATAQRLAVTVTVRDALQRETQRGFTLDVRSCREGETFDCYVPGE